LTTEHTLYLLRHAKSSWSDPALADHERPLAQRGRRDAKRIAEHLVRLGIEPELVLCSSAERTLETLELLRPALGGSTVRHEARLYAAPVEALIELVRVLPHDVASAMLIGHNPGLQELALFLTSPSVERERLEAKFPTAALATVELRVPWSRLSRANAELTGFVVPKQLR
jgi:phosphohistidine phosphatase